MPRGDHWKHWTERLKDGGLTDPSTGCVEWQGSRNSKGYGVIYFDGKLRLAHRAAWLAKHGDWPNPSLVTDHICENKGCVNAEHLRELTNSQNIMRAHPRGDEATELRRARNRVAKARYRAKLKAARGESNSLV